MTVSRFVGTHLIDRFGRVAVLGTSGMVSLAGLVLFGTAPSLPLALVGVVGWGLGAGLAVPIGMVAVSEDPLRAAGRVAVVSAFASVSSIAAPPLLGFAAESMGVRHALLLIGVGMLVSTLLAHQVRPTAEADDDDARATGDEERATRDEAYDETVVVPDTLAEIDPERQLTSGAA